MEVPTEMRTKYVERRKQDLEVCLTSLERLDFSEIAKVGHQLKGNGSTFGYPELSSIGKKMEIAAHNENLPSIEEALKDFSRWVNTIH